MDSDTRSMTIGNWMITLLVLAIPLINIIMYLVWAFGNAGNVNRKTFCQASLIWLVIGVGIAVAIGILGALFGTPPAGV
jgi:Flp pilus assembly protein protease CpaA